MVLLSFLSTWCLIGKQDFVCQRQKHCSCLLTAFVPEPWHRILPAQLYLHCKHVALCNQYPHSLLYPPHPSCPGEVIWSWIQVSDTDPAAVREDTCTAGNLGSLSLLTLVSSLFAEVQITKESWGKKTGSIQNLSEGRILMQCCKA